ncbi:hypothetical protein VB773_14070 [Haloarculaceae archaeon H-GB2-1]|nr:hypothetical protein [Haloarculaceae archaeon H-GB1-1]MEA5387078.1 hypothetical protein [Haloarculaceae archaeon H-GB11]MEA5408583.1 hypothetical protein [Haloarculaceae archaeon H-GB2-1]
MATTLALVYGVVTVLLALAGLSILAMAVRAYRRTGSRSLVLLGLGFGLTVAGGVATLFSGFLTGFESPRLLLLSHSLLTTIGFVVIVYSLLTFE